MTFGTIVYSTLRTYRIHGCVVIHMMSIEIYSSPVRESTGARHEWRGIEEEFTTRHHYQQKEREVCWRMQLVFEW